MSDNQKYYAVLSGDLVKSSRLSADEIGKARSVIAAAVDKFSNYFPHEVVGSAEFYRGDSWEVLLASPKYAMRLSLLVMAELKAKMDVETRIAAGIGPLRHVDSSKITYSMGKASDLSQDAIKNMGKHFNLTAAIEQKGSSLSDQLVRLMHVTSHTTGEWSRDEAKLAAKALHFSGGAVQIQNWDLVAEGLEKFETIDWEAHKKAIAAPAASL